MSDLPSSYFNIFPCFPLPVVSRLKVICKSGRYFSYTYIPSTSIPFPPFLREATMSSAWPHLSFLRAAAPHNSLKRSCRRSRRSGHAHVRGRTSPSLSFPFCRRAKDESKVAHGLVSHIMTTIANIGGYIEESRI